MLHISQDPALSYEHAQDVSRCVARREMPFVLLRWWPARIASVILTAVFLCATSVHNAAASPPLDEPPRGAKTITINKDPFKWTGGWIFGYSGLMYQADLNLPKGSRVMNVKILRQATGLWEPLDPEQTYSFAGFWFPELPDRVGVLTLADVQVLTREGLVVPEDVAAIKDATEVVVDYLRTHDADPMTGRVELLSTLPPPVFGNPEVQPLRGATLE